MKDTENVSEKRWLNPTELEDELGISKSTQAKMRMNRTIPFNKVSKFIRYDRMEIDKWLEDNRVEVAS